MEKVKNIIVFGIGGQGVLKVTDILGEVLFNAGFDLKKSEVHGMSQRGGSVSSEVRYGEKVYSPMTPDGEADVVAVLEESQLDIAKSKLKPNGVVITTKSIPLDKLAHPKALNTMILGAISRHVDLPEALWYDAIKNNFPEKLQQLNCDMFKLGRDEAVDC